MNIITAACNIITNQLSVTITDKNTSIGSLVLVIWVAGPVLREQFVRNCYLLWNGWESNS